MRYLKTFNESVIDGKIEDFNGIRNTLLNTRFTPKYNDVPLKSLYKAIIIKTMDTINVKDLKNQGNWFIVGAKWSDPKEKKFVKSHNYETNWIVLDLHSIIASYSLKILPDIKSTEGWCKNVIKYIDQNDTFENYPIIGYNDINHAEIENILLDYGIQADEIWGIPV